MGVAVSGSYSPRGVFMPLQRADAIIDKCIFWGRQRSGALLLRRLGEPVEEGRFENGFGLRCLRACEARAM